jgi:hypothetical protein
MIYLVRFVWFVLFVLFGAELYYFMCSSRSGLTSVWSCDFFLSRMSVEGYPPRAGTTYTRPRGPGLNFGTPDMRDPAPSPTEVLTQPLVSDPAADGADSLASSASAQMAGQALRVSQESAVAMTDLRSEMRGSVSEITGTVQTLADAVAALTRTVQGQRELGDRGQPPENIPLVQRRTVVDAEEGGARLHGGGQRVAARVAGMARAEDLSGDEQRRAAELLFQANQVDPLPRTFARTPEGGPDVSPVMRALLRVGLRSVEETYAADQQDSAHMEQYASELRRARQKQVSEPAAMLSLYAWQSKFHKSQVMTPIWRKRFGDDAANACVYHFSIVTHLATRPGKWSGWPLAAAYDKRVLDNWDSIDFLDLCTRKPYMDGNLDEALHWNSYLFVKDKIERTPDVKVKTERAKTFCKICKQMVVHKWEDCRRGAPQPSKTAAPGPRKDEKKE